MSFVYLHNAKFIKRKKKGTFMISLIHEVFAVLQCFADYKNSFLVKKK